MLFAHLMHINSAVKLVALETEMYVQYMCLYGEY